MLLTTILLCLYLLVGILITCLIIYLSEEASHSSMTFSEDCMLMTLLWPCVGTIGLLMCLFEAVSKRRNGDD